MIVDLALKGFAGLVLGLVALFVLRRLAPRLGLIDMPGGRKAHGEPVPVVGGVAIFIAFGVCLAMFPVATGTGKWLLIDCALLVLLGLLDDRFQLKASVRMAGQATVALIMIFGAGLAIRSIGNPFFTGEISTGGFVVPFTVLVTITVINAINMTDGMDGLAGGASLVSLLPMLLLLVLAGRWSEAGLLIALLGAITAFLLFNFPVKYNRHIRTFMGDAGSTFLGLVIAWVGISISEGDERLISPVAGLWFIAPAVHDLIASAIRRGRKGKPFWVPDLGHAHHIFLKAGYTPRQTVSAMLAYAMACGLIGLSGPFLGVQDGVLFSLWVVAGLWHIWLVQRAWVFSKILEIVRSDL